METTTQTGHSHAHAEHVHGNGVYHRTLILLLILTAITVGASYIDFGQANIAIALAIATIKALLVALFFMHLLGDKPVNAIIAVGGFLFLGIFLMFCLIDFDTREPLLPRNMPAMEKPTPVPDTLNPLLAAPPKPAAPAPAKAEGGEEHK
jgi:cytochrome c oxidase subunit 4